MNLIVALLFRKKFTVNMFIVQNQVALNYITLLADLPYIKGDTDAEEVVLLLNFTGKKVSDSNLLKINCCMSDSLLLYLNHTKFTQTC